MLIDPLVGVASDEQIVLTWSDHGTQHGPVRCPQVLRLVDDHVLVAVAQVACAGAVIGGRAAPLGVAVASGDLGGGGQFEAGGAVGELAPGFHPVLVQVWR